MECTDLDCGPDPVCGRECGPCQSFETCVDRECIPIDPGSDKDGDGWPNTVDCDDLDPFTYPEDTDNGIPGGYEYCDGEDNDCDREIDEGCRPCRDGDSQPCGTDTGECTQGTQSCANGEWGDCSSQPPTTEEADGLDNDCDGVSDEKLPCSGDETRPCGVQTGECDLGQQRCENDKWSECQDGVMAAPEKCDTLDNDCDGLVDDGFMIGQTCDGIGECGIGLYECQSEHYARCSTEQGGSEDQSSPELCNYRDDDCDMDTDEGFRVGERCFGVGMCGDGMIECISETAADCSSNPGGSNDQSYPEQCDNLDNDCDGDTDEDFDLTSDPDNCGSCNNACAAGESCVDGECV